MVLTAENYYSQEANEEYMSVSQFNGHMHTVVQPEMRALEVIPMHEDAKIAELMGSRK